VSGARLTAVGVWTDASSRALKDEIQSLTVTAGDAHRPQSVKFPIVPPSDPHVGFIAEDADLRDADRGAEPDDT
jgi:hypothetical protein